MEEIDITAGQLHISNATFLLEFYDEQKFPDQEPELLANVFFSITSWMSFDMVESFLLTNIYLGDPGHDYFLKVWKTEQSHLGDLYTDEQIQKYFGKKMKSILTEDYAFDLYQNFFKHHPILRNLVPTYEDVRLNLVDRYFTVFFRPKYEFALDLLIDIGCTPEGRGKRDLVWTIICVDYDNKPDPEEPEEPEEPENPEVESQIF